MSTKENIQGNEVVATLFVGVGGIGSKIIREVVDIATKSNDNLAKARFVILDTDVGDLKKSDDGVSITSIQTSSPRTIRDYLLQDGEAREEWFPNNMIINGKTVSEGAGQVRAISRLALNATIKTGRIKALYQAIDDLYNKDGSDFKQSIKVVVASTVAGGTGSGIAMIVGMLIRNYLATNYPESSAIIRGYLLMPDVMDAAKPRISSSEQLSLQRNGYATLKEINAFMMRPFFEAVPELNRYLDLHVEVPNAAGGVDRLTTSPFDFCFLFERTDANTTKMDGIGQYRSYAAHSIYEQSIGAMSAKASSKEDNIHKEFLDEKKLSRNRFGGAGASIIRYPYEHIRDYVAYEWIEKQMIGHSSAEMNSDDMKKAITNSWLVYDNDYFNKLTEYNSGNISEEPNRGEVYTSGVEFGNEAFTKMLNEKFIEPKNAKYESLVADKGGKPVKPGRSGNKNDEAGVNSNEPKKDAVIPAVEYYIRQMVEHCLKLYETSENAVKDRERFDNHRNTTSTGSGVSKFKTRYDAIDKYIRFVDDEKIKKVVCAFIDRSFNSANKISNKSEQYSIEGFLSLDGKALHPNAMRYLLYKLYAQLDKESKKQSKDMAVFKEEVDGARLGQKNPETGKREVSAFKVGWNGKEEITLLQMCSALDASSSGHDDEKANCNILLQSFGDIVYDAYEGYARYFICDYAKTLVERMINQFEKFYDSFQSKVTGLEKRKKTILTKVAFENGDCEYNLFNKPEHLQKLVDEQVIPTSGTAEERELFSKIYDAIKENGKNAEILKSDAFADVSTSDIFEDVVVEQYKKIVESNCPSLDVDVVRACGLECQIIAMCKAENNPKDAEEILKAGKSEVNKNAHLKKRIDKGFNLASPSIIRKSFEEDRKIESMSYNAQIEEGDGMKMPDTLFDKEFASNTVTKYELHFFRSIYGIMPTEIHKMSSPQKDPGKPDNTSTADDNEKAEAGMVGAYFAAYQDYMRKIGPDNRLNPVITPHIDKRWNSVTVMPELDPQGYQRVLMKRIHKALIYGIIYERIEKRQASPYDSEMYIYEYVDGRNGSRKLTVSNHTRCDRLFEVLDALYFDRYAVHSIHDAADNIRNKEYEASTPYEKTTFAKYLKNIDRKLLINEFETMIAETDKNGKEVIRTVGEVAKKIENNKVSIFELPLLYWNSLPKKDAAELEIMVDAVLEVIYAEVAKFSDKDNVDALVAKTIREHYDLLYKNYEECRELYDNYKREPQNNSAFKVIRKKVLEKFDELQITKSKFQLVDHTEKDDLFSC